MKIARFSSASMVLALSLLAVLPFRPQAAPSPEVVVTPGGGAHSEAIAAAIAGLPEPRKRIATVRLIGDFTIDQTISLPSRTRLDLSDASLTLAAGANTDMITNSDHEEGNELIEVVGGVVDGNQAEQGAGESYGIRFFRADDLLIRDLVVENCRTDGIHISGKGRHTRNLRMSNVYSRGNGRMGVAIMWAMRSVVVENLIINDNRGLGLRSDHSEGSYTNVTADGNGGHGIFIRNVFGNTYTNLTASRNGEAGIYVLGLLQSSGSNWNAHNNSRSADGEWSDVHFVQDESLSYGRTGHSIVTNIVAGGYHQYGSANEAYALFIEPPADGAYEEFYIRGVIASPGVAGDVSAPEALDSNIIVY